jgi:hypothetical protein
MMDKFPKTLRQKRIWAILVTAVILIIASLWIEGLSPIYQRLGIARSVEIPICACIGLNDPGDGSPPDEKVDLDPSMDDYNKSGWVLKKTDQSMLLVRFSTQEQLYNFLKTRGSDLCLATDVGAACMTGRIVLTEVVDGEHRTIDYGGPACEFTTQRAFEWITPVVKVNNCLLPNGREKDATNPPPPLLTNEP